jgi:hypothetical protein
MKTKLTFPRSLAIGTVLFLAVLPRATFARRGSDGHEATEDLIGELASTPDFGIVYVADGAGDGTVLNDKPSAAVKKIVNLSDAAIPLLIRHLDDTRTTSAMYKGGKYWAKPITVPVGYLCLDILSQIVKDKKELFVQGRRDCDFDGMGACIRSKYYFYPEAAYLRSSKVPSVKGNWEAANQVGLLKFRFPSWLGRFRAAYSMNQ